MMLTYELIAALRERDPSGDREVWLEIHNGERGSEHRVFTDTAAEVFVDMTDDIVIRGDQS